MNKLTIYGPPGTGKTTYLMDLLEKEMKTLSPNKIAFVSFTKKGTNEGAQRAKTKFKMKNEELHYFKTLHALCFRELNTSRMDMINKGHYKLLSKMTGINFTGYYTEDFSSSNDAYLHIAAMERHNPRLAFRLANQLNETRFQYIKFQFNELKKQLGIVDFDDLLVDYLKHGQPLPIKVAFIDEAQDLTPLQWQVAIKMFSNVERIFVAGDDDQAVYEWSGADVNSFLTFSKKCKILNHSYRMPEKILKLSKKLTKDITKRQTKEFKSNGKEGVIQFEKSFRDLNLSGGELILARTNWILRQLSFEALNEGHSILFKGKLSIDKAVLKAIRAYNSYIINDDPAVFKYKTKFQSITKQKLWQHTIDLPEHEITYYEKVLRQSSDKKIPIIFETFHSSKGSENDQVILSYDLTTKVHENFFNNRDSELRCLYVGVTRAKKSLTILAPKNKEHYPEKYFKEGESYGSCY